MLSFHGKRVLVTGGTGSLGRTLVRRLLCGEFGKPAKITVFSRDEAKQHEMRLDYLERRVATDDAIYQDFQKVLSFAIGDVRDYKAVVRIVRDVDVIFHAAALKQVPTCEYFPFEAVRTNVEGTHNIVTAINDTDAPVDVVVGISTDKACKPISVMGMTKALQERVFVEANLTSKRTRYVGVRYGNVIASRGSVVPLFLDQIRRGGPVTVTLPEMTRFLMTLDTAVDTVFAAMRSALPGETYIPVVPSARVVDIAKALIGDRDIPVVFTGIRPGEKIHEILVSEEECYRTIQRDGHYVIRPLMPELRATPLGQAALMTEYSSGDDPMPLEEVRALLEQRQLVAAV
jgi:FlaA1/EpsC-like NDP-sugar epimerase